MTPDSDRITGIAGDQGSPNGEAEIALPGLDLGHNLYARYGEAPGILSNNTALERARRTLHFSLSRLPLLGQIQTRWPAISSAYGLSQQYVWRMARNRNMQAVISAPAQAITSLPAAESKSALSSTQTSPAISAPSSRPVSAGNAAPPTQDRSHAHGAPVFLSPGASPGVDFTQAIMQPPIIRRFKRKDSKTAGLLRSSVARPPSAASNEKSAVYPARPTSANTALEPSGDYAVPSSQQNGPEGELSPGKLSPKPNSAIFEAVHQVFSPAVKAPQILHARAERRPAAAAMSRQHATTSMSSPLGAGAAGQVQRVVAQPAAPSGGSGAATPGNVDLPAPGKGKESMAEAATAASGAAPGNALENSVLTLGLSSRPLSYSWGLGSEFKLRSGNFGAGLFERHGETSVLRRVETKDSARNVVTIVSGMQQIPEPSFQNKSEGEPSAAEYGTALHLARPKTVHPTDPAVTHLQRSLAAGTGATGGQQEMAASGDAAPLPQSGAPRVGVEAQAEKLTAGNSVLQVTENALPPLTTVHRKAAESEADRNEGEHRVHAGLFTMTNEVPLVMESTAPTTVETASVHVSPVSLQRRTNHTEKLVEPERGASVGKSTPTGTTAGPSTQEIALPQKTMAVRPLSAAAGRSPAGQDLVVYRRTKSETSQPVNGLYGSVASTDETNPVPVLRWEYSSSDAPKMVQRIWHNDTASGELPLPGPFHPVQHSPAASNRMQRSASGIASPIMPPPVTAQPPAIPAARPQRQTTEAQAGADLTQLANSVYNLLVRRLAAERQRRGL